MVHGERAADGRIYWGGRPDQLAALAVAHAAEHGFRLELRPETPVVIDERFTGEGLASGTWSEIEALFRRWGDVGCHWVTCGSRWRMARRSFGSRQGQMANPCPTEACPPATAASIASGCRCRGPSWSGSMAVALDRRRALDSPTSFPHAGTRRRVVFGRAPVRAAARRWMPGAGRPLCQHHSGRTMSW
jgi:hypothetical protein